MSDLSLLEMVIYLSMGAGVFTIAARILTGRVDLQNLPIEDPQDYRSRKKNRRD